MNIPAGLIAAAFTMKDGALHYSMPVDESRKAVFQAGSRVADAAARS
jgi:hypothetical protein